MEWTDATLAFIGKVLEFVGAEPSVFPALLLSMLATEGVKQFLLPKVATHRSKVARVRLALRATAFVFGLIATLLLWEGSLRYGLVWGLVVGFGSPLAYQAIVGWGLEKGYGWAKRLQAQDAILRKHPVAPDEPAEEGTILGAARRQG